MTLYELVFLVYVSESAHIVVYISALLGICTALSCDIRSKVACLSSRLTRSGSASVEKMWAQPAPGGAPGAGTQFFLISVSSCIGRIALGLN